MKEVAAVNRARMEALLDTGEIVPITKIHADVTAVAGPCIDDKWYSIDLTEFEAVTVQ